LGGSSREGHDLRHQNSRSSIGDRSGTMRLEGLEGEDDEEAR